MKVKWALFYVAPVALAGFLYLGEIDPMGVGEVLAKTVKTVVMTEVKGTPDRIYSDSKLEAEDDKYYYEHIQGGGYTSYIYYQYPKIRTGMETEIDVPDDIPNHNEVKIVPTVDPEAEEAENAKRQEEAAVKVQKEAEQKTEDFVKEIVKVAEQAVQASVRTDEANEDAAGTPTAVIKTDYFTCFTQDMLKQLAVNPNVNYEIHYRYQGKRYVVVIPAGTDYSQLKDSNGYYGFRYLDSIFGGYEEKTK